MKKKIFFQNGFGVWIKHIVVAVICGIVGAGAKNVGTISQGLVRNSNQYLRSIVSYSIANKQTATAITTAIQGVINREFAKSVIKIWSGTALTSVLSYHIVNKEAGHGI